ncbi:MAG: EF-hand domain-containing protein [Acidobacteriota bacterium]
MSLARRLLPPVALVCVALGPLSALAQTKPAPAPRRDWADRYLVRVDTDKKGYITLLDAERYAGQQFDRLDANRDGVVDHDEFTAALKRSLDRVRAERKPAVQRALDRRETLFHTLDQHSDGRLTKDEYLAAARQHFTEIDTGKTGKITAADLRTARHGL